MKPFLKWAGGKSQLLTQYSQYFPSEFNKYYEPFLGGGSIFFYLKPKTAILSDLNEELINCYSVVRDYVEDLIITLETIYYLNDKNFFLQVRALDWKQLNKIEAAARMIYLNKTCFNGLYRVNGKGEFNTSFGKYKNPTICNPNVLRECSQILKTTELYSKDFQESFNNCQENDFIYLDPPYFPLNKTSNFTAYTAQGFSELNQNRLKLNLDHLTKKKVKVIMSNSERPEIRELYKDYRIIEISARRNINSDGQKRGKIGELLILNY